MHQVISSCLQQNLPAVHQGCDRVMGLAFYHLTRAESQFVENFSGLMLYILIDPLVQFANEYTAEAKSMHVFRQGEEVF